MNSSLNKATRSVRANARTLTADHRAILERGSAISPEVIAERGYWTAATWQELRAGGVLLRQSQNRTECYPALVVPVWTPDGESPHVVVRWDVPRITPVALRLIRYDAPALSQPRLDVPPRCRPALADPGTVLWITEGSKKADSLASHGAVAVSLPGVWSWRTPTVQADFDSIVFRGRRVILAFDSDVMEKPSVRLAAIRLGRWLGNRRADVGIVDWASVLQVGVAA